MKELRAELDSPRPAAHLRMRPRKRLGVLFHWRERRSADHSGLRGSLRTGLDAREPRRDHLNADSGHAVIWGSGPPAPPVLRRTAPRPPPANAPLPRRARYVRLTLEVTVASSQAPSLSPKQARVRTRSGGVVACRQYRRTSVVRARVEARLRGRFGVRTGEAAEGTTGGRGAAMGPCRARNGLGQRSLPSILSECSLPTGAVPRQKSHPAAAVRAARSLAQRALSPPRGSCVGC